MVTAYDFPTACIGEEVGIDVLLVGDSVGTNVLGYESECQVTMADMIHHVKAVARATRQCCLMADIPYGGAKDPVVALENSRILLSNGAHLVKMEGWEDRREITAHLSENGVAVCGHIGYNPQYHGHKARIFGKDAAGARELLRSAQVLEQAGAVMLVAEKIPEELGRLISSKVSIPVIGIGSGRHCDGQVLVFHDIVGLTPRTFRHARAYANIREVTAAALKEYKEDVESRRFPADEHVWHLPEEVLRVMATERIT